MADTIRVLHFSSHDEDCGVGRYQEQYLVGMEKLPGIHNKFFAISPYKTREMSPEELQQTMNQLADELKDFDILHIQHEFGLYWHDELPRLVETAQNAGKRVVITVHLSPDYAIKPVKLGGLGPRSLVSHVREKRHYDRMVEYHIEPMRKADMVIVHNEVTRKSLERFGIEATHITKMIHPVYEVPAPKPTTEIAKALQKKPGDVIYCITGFLHRYKGILGAVHALKFLPSNYKLALIGGVKADSDDVGFQDKVTDLIDQLGLRDRVYITGFVQDDDRMNALIRECDVCVYPYDKVYYSNLSSGSLNLSFANDVPAIAYPTASFKEVTVESKGALKLCDTFAYYELARELQRLDTKHQLELSRTYAERMAWPKMAKELVKVYQHVLND